MINEQKDLCTNCLNAAGCMYCKTKPSPVQFCEEYTCKPLGITAKFDQRLKRAEAMFLPKGCPGLFDDCGTPAQGS